MKHPFRQYGSVVALLACIVALSVVLTVLTGGLSLHQPKEERHTVLATTYPVYVAAQNILGEDTTIVLTRLDGAASGCLHDYQMSPADRRGVEEAELILMNGAGAETFLHGIVDEDKCVDTSQGIDLLCAAHDHDHDHGEEEHHHEEYNEHLWLSPSRYKQQVEAVRDALCALNPGMAAVYEANAADYVSRMDGILFMMNTYTAALEGRPCVLFHDSMAYLAADLGLDVKLTLSVEGESGLSAADLKQVEQLAAQHSDLILFYDTQYAQRYEGLRGAPLAIDTAVQGEGNPDDWLTAMEYNVDQIMRLLEVYE